MTEIEKWWDCQSLEVIDELLRQKYNLDYFLNKETEINLYIDDVNDTWMWKIYVRQDAYNNKILEIVTDFVGSNLINQYWTGRRY